MISDIGFAKAAEILGSTDAIGPATRLLPEGVCQEVIHRIETGLPKSDKDWAIDCTASLLRRHGRWRIDDPKHFAIGLHAAFMARSRGASQHVANSFEWDRLSPPFASDVMKALDAEETRRKLLHANAKAHLVERDRREELIAVANEFERNRPAREERLRQMEKLLGADRVKSILGEDRHA